MKKIYTIIILTLSTCNLFSQTLDDIQKSDSIYFYFSANEHQKKKISSTNSFTKDTTLHYSYLKNGKDFLVFRYSKYENFDAFDTNTKTYKQYHKKSFLRKNKQRIIDIDFINNLSLNTQEFRDIIERKKLFLIDEDDIKGRKILTREIFISIFDTINTSGTETVNIFKTRNILPFYFEMQINDTFYSFLAPKEAHGKKDIYILFESSNRTDKYIYNHVTLIGDKKSEPKIQEQYTFKLNLKSQVIFFQLTNKRNQNVVLEKKYDLFSRQHEIISFDDLNSFSEKQLENLFSKTRNIYVVEDFSNRDYVLPKLVKITTEINAFVEQNNE